ncbi:hypothetical protein [Streptomyces gilvus]|uniref:hypothetical protein n=1 Tax=Streptomyces gilvus TaxID=2920937 RepID=UPI001F0FC62A|nr:hypothetical protein [Streptomyces sp. CME 23]MCH5676129.1 hypothetical protein [Streptomyces sp. CME 23]
MTEAVQLAATQDAQIIPPMTFVVPEGVHALPVDASAAERPTAAAEFVRGLYPGGDDSLWQSAAPFYELLTEAMATAGLAFSAFGLFALDTRGVAHCAFTVAAYASDHTDPDIAAQGILATLSADPMNDARWLDLPCGPAVSRITLRELALSADITASGEPATLLTGQIQVHIPFPTGPFTAVFTIDTAAMEYWGEFCDMTTAVLQTVSFTDPAIDASAA